MAGAPAPVGDDGRGALHHRLPVRIRHVGHQHVPRLNAGHVRDVVHEPRGPAADALADAAPGAEHLAPGFQLEALQTLGGGAALDGLRPGLKDVDPAVLSVLSPLDVHGPAVVILDLQRVTGERLHIVVFEGEHTLLALRYGLDAHPLRAVVGEHHAQRLAAPLPAHDGGTPLAKRRFVHVELVRVHLPLDHRLAEPPGSGDEDHLVETRLRIHGEHDAARTGVAAHHALHAGGQRNLSVIEILVHPVGDGPIVVERRVHGLDGGEHVIDAGHIEEGLLLPREGGLGQILGGGRRTHRHGRTGVTFRERFVGGPDIGLEGIGKRRFGDPAAHPVPGGREGRHVFHVETVQLGGDARLEVVATQELPEGVGGRRETAGHAHSGGRHGSNHLAKRGVLAAHGGDVAHTNGVEPDYTFHKAFPNRFCGSGGGCRRAFRWREHSVARLRWPRRNRRRPR